MKDNKFIGTLQIGAITWKVIEQDRDDVHGQANLNLNRIVISNRVEKQAQALAFYHELTHAILYTMGHELYDNEEFVNTFSAFLHQAISTKEFKK